MTARGSAIDDLTQPFGDYKSRVESAMDAILPPTDAGPALLHEAMRYACLDGGKRIRAMLVYAAGSVVGADPQYLDVPACAVEFIHAYSLVHDDLPAMDDDALRRGKPTCHVRYGEATAILVGDALHSLAFEIVAGQAALPAPVRVQMVFELARAAGHAGMVGGQVRDIDAEGKGLSLEELTALHRGKTGALIECAVVLGALCGGEPEPGVMAGLRRYAGRIGLAFQIIDDVLDEVSDTETLGKRSGADRALAKATFPSVVGLQASRTMARRCHAEAVEALEKLDADTHVLQRIADLVIDRRH